MRWLPASRPLRALPFSCDPADADFDEEWEQITADSVVIRGNFLHNLQHKSVEANHLLASFDPVEVDDAPLSQKFKEMYLAMVNLMSKCDKPVSLEPLETSSSRPGVRQEIGKQMHSASTSIPTGA